MIAFGALPVVHLKQSGDAGVSKLCKMTGQKISAVVVVVLDADCIRQRLIFIMQKEEACAFAFQLFEEIGVRRWKRTLTALGDQTAWRRLQQGKEKLSFRIRIVVG